MHLDDPRPRARCQDARAVVVRLSSEGLLLRMSDKAPTPLENLVASLEALIIVVVAAMGVTVVWVAVL
jgi:hypothetical protein